MKIEVTANNRQKLAGTLMDTAGSRGVSLPPSVAHEMLAKLCGFRNNHILVSKLLEESRGKKGLAFLKSFSSKNKILPEVLGGIILPEVLGGIILPEVLGGSLRGNTLISGQLGTPVFFAGVYPAIRQFFSESPKSGGLLVDNTRDGFEFMKALMVQNGRDPKVDLIQYSPGCGLDLLPPDYGPKETAEYIVSVFGHFEWRDMFGRGFAVKYFTYLKILLSNLGIKSPTLRDYVNLFSQKGLDNALKATKDSVSEEMRLFLTEVFTKAPTPAVMVIGTIRENIKFFAEDKSCSNPFRDQAKLSLSNILQEGLVLVVPRAVHYHEDIICRAISCQLHILFDSKENPGEFFAVTPFLHAPSYFEKEIRFLSECAHTTIMNIYTTGEMLGAPNCREYRTKDIFDAFQTKIFFKNTDGDIQQQAKRLSEVSLESLNLNEALICRDQKEPVRVDLLHDPLCY